MSVVLTTAYIIHVASAALWTGATLYFVRYIMPPALTEDTEDGGYAFYSATDGLLRVTRWTGIALPVTGVYLIWELYTYARLFETTRGWLVIAMALLWLIMNGVMEIGTLRMREVVGDVDMKEYFAEGFPHAPEENVTVAEVAEAGRPYMLVAAGLAILLLIDASLIATGLV